VVFIAEYNSDVDTLVCSDFVVQLYTKMKRPQLSVVNYKQMYFGVHKSYVPTSVQYIAW